LLLGLNEPLIVATGLAGGAGLLLLPCLLLVAGKVPAGTHMLGLDEPFDGMNGLGCSTFTTDALVLPAKVFSMASTLHASPVPGHTTGCDDWLCEMATTSVKLLAESTLSRGWHRDEGEISVSALIGVA
jgi:hypothetical protein